MSIGITVARVNHTQTYPGSSDSAYGWKKSCGQVDKRHELLGKDERFSLSQFDMIPFH